MVTCFEVGDVKGSSSRVGFNVPPNTLQVISVTIFTGQITESCNSVKPLKDNSPPGKGPIPPGQALYKVKGVGVVGVYFIELKHCTNLQCKKKISRQRKFLILAAVPQVKSSLLLPVKFTMNTALLA